MIEFNEREALRYLKANKDDKAAQILVDTVYLKLRNEVQARYCVKRFQCKVDAEGVTLDCGVRFTSRLLAKHLADCEELLLLGATLGMRVDAAIRRLTLLSVTEGAAAQAVGAALIESYLDGVQSKIQSELDAEASAKEQTPLQQKTRFSPGYGDWALEEQKLLFPLLDCAKSIGLTLTDGCMMVPTKSVTAVIGLTHKCQPARVGHKCNECSNIDCEYREK